MTIDVHDNDEESFLKDDTIHNIKSFADANDEESMEEVCFAIPLVSRNRHEEGVERSGDAFTENNLSLNDDCNTRSVFMRIQPFACCTIAAVQILLFLALVGLHGFAPRSNNPFIGPPCERIDYFGAKNTAKIKNGEMWRVFTSLFLSAGLLDLICAVGMIVTFGSCLEKRWGARKFVFVYVVAGVSGNLYSTFWEPNSTSVGNGACIFGLLGAVYIDLMSSVFYFHRQKNKTDELNPIDDPCFIRSVVVSSGMLFGLLITNTLQSLNMKQNMLSLEKDWGVLYGGMLGGICCGIMSNAFASEIEWRKKCFYCAALSGVPILLSGLFYLQL